MTHADSNLIAEAKKAAAKAALDFIEDGMIVGLGTGSTASYFIDLLGLKCKEGLRVHAIATSQQSAKQALTVGIPLLDEQSVTKIDIGVDGADEIDHHKNITKGGGGALLREKLVACASQQWTVIIDETKLVDHLGAFPLPVEIAKFAYQTTLNRLLEAGYKGTMRLKRDKSLYITDNENYIFDIQFEKPILNPEEEQLKLVQIPGVLETGFFLNLAQRIIVGYEDGCVKIRE